MENSFATLKIGTIRNLPVRMHITLFIMLIWLVAVQAPETSTIHQLALPVIVFLSLLVREGLKIFFITKKGMPSVKEVTLYPFGGFFNFEQELQPRIAIPFSIIGPCTSFFLTALTFSYIDIGSIEDPKIIAENLIKSPLINIFMLNAFWTFFALLPIYPLEGGIMSQAILRVFKIKNGESFITTFGPYLAIFLATFTFLAGNHLATYILLTLFVTSLSESVRAKSKKLSTLYSVQEVMIPSEDLDSLTHGTLIPDALKLMQKSFQSSFPVMLGQQLIGIVDKDKIIEAVATKKERNYLSEYMNKNFTSITPEATLEQAMEVFSTYKAELLPVILQGKFMGAIFKEKIREFLMIANFRENAKDIPDEPEMDI